MEIKQREVRPKYGDYSNMADARFELGTMDVTAIPKIDGKYITGLDRYSPTVKSIKDDKERAKKIEELNSKRTDLSIRLGIELDQDTEEGKQFWKSLTLDFSDIKFLNADNPMEELFMYIVKENSRARTFPVATEKEDLGGDLMSTKDYYIADNDRDLEIRVSNKLKVSRAQGLLSSIADDKTKLENIALLLLPRVIPINKHTKPGYLYDKLDDLLQGNLDSVKTSHYKLIEEFTDLMSIPTSDLVIKAIIERAFRHNILAKNHSTGEYYNLVYPEYRYGKTTEEVFSYFSDPSNQEELGLYKKTDKHYSLTYLISQKEL